MTKVDHVVNFFGNVCSYKLTMGGLQTRTLDKSQAKHCEQYANFVYNLNVEQFVEDNFDSNEIIFFCLTIVSIDLAVEVTATNVRSFSR